MSGCVRSCRGDTPREIDKSEGPTYTPSRPSTSSISSRFLMASAVSIMANTRTYLLASSGGVPIIRALVGPQLLTPCGGYRHCSTSFLAWSAVLIMGPVFQWLLRPELVISEQWS